MNKINKFILTTHRILGTLLSAVFLMWFLTGIVMLYHGHFPRADKSSTMEPLCAKANDAMTLQPIDSLTHGAAFSSITLDSYMSHTVYHVATPDTTFDVTPAGTPDSIVVNSQYIDKVVKYWCKGDVASVDTLKELNQWIPFGRLKKELPVLRYSFNDEEAHELYVGSKTGNVLQFTSHEQRVWAWLGPIPHWVYFTWLRTNQDAWMNTVIAISGVGCLMIITGIWMGVVVLLRTRRNKKNKLSPYKKKWYHWHYVTGLVFGLFCLTYVFSGMMSLVKNPPAIISERQLDFSPMKALDEAKADTFLLDYRKVLAAEPEATAIEWKHVGNIPYYSVSKKKGKSVCYDARTAAVKKLKLSEQDILDAVKAVYKEDGVDASAATAELQDYQELYYRVHAKDSDKLPIVKVTVNDADNDVLYINPSNGSVRFVDNTGRWAYWLYPALHKLRLPFTMNAEWLRLLLSWIILLGGTAVSLTGVILGCRYIKRLF